MKRIIILTLLRKLKERNIVCSFKESEKHIVLSDLWESKGKKLVKNFCKNNNLPIKYIGSDSYIIVT